MLYIKPKPERLEWLVHYFFQTKNLQISVINILFLPFINVDVNECVTRAFPKDRECDEYADCTNTVGSYYCACKPGFTGDGFFCKGACIVNIFMFCPYFDTEVNNILQD